ncbi:putative nuclease HARBI1 [Calliphora vicina]|uniref:putative nuclease HARBI1 n=1 Tax=Calliphora vicina TaxID=7373 RepID=UPI00325AE0BB
MPPRRQRNIGRRTRLTRSLYNHRVRQTEEERTQRLDANRVTLSQCKINLLYDSSDESDTEITIRRRRLFRPRLEYEFLESTLEYNERFRLKRDKFILLLNLLSPILENETNRSHSLTVQQQLLITLRWLGTGTTYHAVGDLHGVSKATVCRLARKHGSSGIQILRHERHAVSLRLFDGTLIKLDAPKEHEEAYFDRHGNHSISCMVVCGPDLQFYYSYANWPGSTHDSRVLRNSCLFRRMENGWRPIQNGIILGDSAYPLKDWLIPPLSNNRRFLNTHKSTRRVVENAIGILKEKFPVLNYLRMSPEMASDVFNCAVTLCNFSRTEEDENFRITYPSDSDNDEEVNQTIADSRGQARLQTLLNYFN